MKSIMCFILSYGITTSKVTSVISISIIALETHIAERTHIFSKYMREATISCDRMRELHGTWSMIYDACWYGLNDSGWIYGYYIKYGYHYGSIHTDKVFVEAYMPYSNVRFFSLKTYWEISKYYFVFIGDINKNRLNIGG